MYVASRGTLLLAGVLFSLAGGVPLTRAVYRGFRSWYARRADGSAARTEPLPRGFRAAKSLRGEPLLERPPLRYYEVTPLILYGTIGLMFVTIGVYLLLGAFGIVGPLYTNTP